MLCAIRASDGKEVVAGNEVKPLGGFSCPSCKEAMVLRSGKLRKAHFAHHPPVTCRYGEGETEERRRSKAER